MKSYLKLVFGIVAIAFVMTISQGAEAQKKSGGVIRLEVTTIEGRVQKPNAFFINTRRSLVYETMEIKESFVSEISRVVDNGDF